jgi:hypothetical protein
MVTKNILVNAKRNRWYSPLFPATYGTAGVKADAPDPGLDTAFATEFGVTFPKIDQHLLEKVINISRIVREKVAYRIYGLTVLLDHFCEF